MKYLSLLVLLMLALRLQAQAPQTIPDATLKDLDGKNVELKSLIKEGEITFVTFWATWCSPCKKELDNLLDLYPEWKEQYKVHIIAISVDDARTMPRVKSTVKNKGWDYTFLCDPNQDMQRVLNFQSVPQSFLLNQKGEIVYSHSSYKEGDEYELEKKIKALAEQK